MNTFEEKYTGEPVDLQYTKENLLMPGFSGTLERYELEFIKSQLLQSPSLKRRWGFRPSAKRCSEARIRHVAEYGVERKSRRAVLASVEKAENSSE